MELLMSEIAIWLLTLLIIVLVLLGLNVIWPEVGVWAITTLTKQAKERLWVKVAWTIVKVVTELLTGVLIVTKPDDRRWNEADSHTSENNLGFHSTDSGSTLPPLSLLSLQVIKTGSRGGPTIGTQYQLIEGGNAIGRDLIAEPYIHLIEIAGDYHMSRDHAYLEIQEDDIVRIHNRSKHGTRVNGQRINNQTSVTARVGDVILMGSTTFRLTTHHLSVPSEKTMKVAHQRFSVLKGPDQGKDFFLTSSSFLIGRARDNDWFLSDPTISRRHAQVRPEGENVYIDDLESSQGVLVNGTRYKSRALKVGDVVTLGNSELVFESIS